MTETSGRIATVCPACSPEIETVHEVLKPGGQATVRCTECSHVHKATVEDDAEVERRVVVSQSGESLTATVEGPPDEKIQVGEEFVVDPGEALMVVRITDLQVGTEQRTDSARMDEVETIWTRAVDNVTVNVTLHPDSGDETRGVEVQVPGDHEFEVGATEQLGGEEFTVKGIHVRENAVGYPAEKLDRRGDAVEAKDVTRVYARDESSSAWSAW
ncbi:MAG: HVO_0476 family zinc finger protein [Halobacteriales archaeon]